MTKYLTDMEAESLRDKRNINWRRECKHLLLINYGENDLTGYSCRKGLINRDNYDCTGCEDFEDGGGC